MISIIKRLRLYISITGLTGAVVFAIGWLQYRHAPTILQYLPQNYQYFVLTPSLHKLSTQWEMVFPNLFSSQGGYLGGDKPDGLRVALSEACIESLSAENLQEMGLDTHRSALYSGFEYHGNDIEMAILPTTDKLLLIKWLSTGHESHKIELQWYGDQSPVAFELSLQFSESGVLCETESRRDGRPVRIDGDPVTITYNGDMPQLRYLPFQDGALQMNCRALYSDGSSGTCDCRLEGEPCLKTPFKVEELADASSGSASTYPTLALKNNMLVALPPGDDIIVYRGSSKEIPPLAGNTADNFRYHFNRNAVVSGGTHSSGDVLAQLSGSFFVSGGKTPLTIKSEGRDVTLSASIPVNDLGLQAMHSLLTPNAEPATAPYLPRGMGASFILRDRYLADYLLFYHNHFYDEELFEEFGHYQVIYRRLIGKASLSAVQIYLHGFQQGIPKLTISIGLNKKEAAQYVSDLQHEFRAARDLALLNKLYKKYPDRLDAYTRSKWKVKTSSYLKTLAKHQFNLALEPANNWDRYDFDGKRYQLANSGDTGSALIEENLVAQVYDVEEFEVPATEAERATKEKMQYLLPPSTQNDITLLYEKYSEDEIDTQAILAGEYRMVTAYDPHSETLWISDVPQNLLAFLNRSIPEIADKAQLTNATQYDKILVLADLPWLRAQSLLHPDDDISKKMQEVLEGFRQFEYVKMAGNVADGGRLDVKSRFIAR